MKGKQIYSCIRLDVFYLAFYLVFARRPFLSSALKMEVAGSAETLVVLLPH